MKPFTATHDVTSEATTYGPEAKSLTKAEGASQSLCGAAPFSVRFIVGPGGGGELLAVAHETSTLNRYMIDATRTKRQIARSMRVVRHLRPRRVLHNTTFLMAYPKRAEPTVTMTPATERSVMEGASTPPAALRSRLVDLVHELDDVVMVHVYEQTVPPCKSMEPNAMHMATVMIIWQTTWKRRKPREITLASPQQARSNGWFCW
mmetsp:Transcript_27712/g.70661  ORF Transcript_27712/g.70661 Transcript_27712/m.70661 type:complete len:205 (-) Transcript_27712:577-1191(-)